MAEREGFEPSRACTLPLFESGQFNHSCTSPHGYILTKPTYYPRSVILDSFQDLLIDWILNLVQDDEEEK
jgi:hypothetical protein